MRWLIVFTVMVLGCVSTLPVDDVGLTADLATQTAYALGKMKSAQPEGDVCKNCNGTGKIGDGRIVNVCPECKGTGKR